MQGWATEPTGTLSHEGGPARTLSKEGPAGRRTSGGDAILDDMRQRERAASMGRRGSANFGNRLSALTDALQDDPGVALGKAARAGNMSLQLMARALEAGAPVDQRDQWGYTPLHEVAKVGATNGAELLLSSMALVDTADNDGFTPLHSAALGGHTEMVELLLNAGADPNARSTHSGATPLDLAVKHGHADTAEAIVTRGIELRGVHWTEYDALFKAQARALAPAEATKKDKDKKKSRSSVLLDERVINNCG